MKKLISLLIIVGVMLAGVIFFLQQRKTWEPFDTAKDSIEFLAEMYNQQVLFYATYGTYTSDVKYLMDQAYLPIDTVNYKFGFLDAYESAKGIDELPAGHDSSIYNSDQISAINYTLDISSIDFLKSAAKNCPEAIVTERAFTFCMIVPFSAKDNQYGVITINNEKEITKKILEF